MGDIPSKLRFEVLKRDGFRCTYCGRSPERDGVALHVDHVVARVAGGTTTLDNLRTACADCNHGKSDHPLDGPPRKRPYTRRVHLPMVGTCEECAHLAYWDAGPWTAQYDCCHPSVFHEERGRHVEYIDAPPPIWCPLRRRGVAR